MTRRYLCITCSDAFTRSGRYIGHYCPECRPTPPNRCGCGQSFDSAEALNGHRAHCTGD